MAQIATGVVRTISTILAWIGCTFISACEKETKGRMQMVKTNFVKLPFRRICNCCMYAAKGLDHDFMDSVAIMHTANL